MTDGELLEKVKSGLCISDTFNDANISIKILAVKQYMQNAGVSSEHIESDLGIAILTVGVNDLWNLASGEVQFSKAFNMIFEQLKVISLPD